MCQSVREPQTKPFIVYSFMYFCTFISVLCIPDCIVSALRMTAAKMIIANIVDFTRGTLKDLCLPGNSDM